MTNLEKIRNMTAEEMATAIINSISSDPCDYCKYSSEYCTGLQCSQKSGADIIKEWLESEEKTE